jgi:DNA-binding transcriptional regulator PaaX
MFIGEVLVEEVFMKAKTELFLYMLLWTYDTLTRPTGNNLTDNFESWAYRRGLHREIVRLENLALVESRASAGDQRIVRLTETGRLWALGGREPEACWGKPWDGLWRVVVFDVPVSKNSVRNRLRLRLRQRGFGCLQGSVWITPHPVTDERKALAGERVNVESMVLLEARPCAGEKSHQIVLGAWDFNKINEKYEVYRRVSRERPPVGLAPDRLAEALLRWVERERDAWMAAVTIDPLLPACLLPRGYQGQKAWEAHVEAQSAAREYSASLDGRLSGCANS